MSVDLVRWGADRLRVGPWRGDTRTAYVAPLAEGAPTTAEAVRQCCTLLAGRGFRAVITAALLAELLDAVDIVRIVHPLDLGAGGRPRQKSDDRVVEVGAAHSVEHGIESRWTFGVAPAGHVIEIALMRRQQDRHSRRG